jgi:hypothetical protein
MRSIFEEEAGPDLQKTDLRKIDLQHINVKLLLEGGGNLDPIIPIFHSWIQEQVFDGLLIDVADYRHVHHGPGIVLIGHEADYSIDNIDGRPGLRYNRKTQLDVSNHEKLSHALRVALAAAERLQSDTRLNARLNFNGHDIELFVNDRLIAPNNDETRVAIDPELRAFFNKLFAGTEYSLRYETDPRKLFGAAIHSARALTVEGLLQNLAG